ncbi:MAG TPA: S16 family serine protease [Pseudonocardia sp.]
MTERSEPALVSRRSHTFAVGLFLLLVAGLLTTLVQVPLVALGPGPTYNTIGDVGGKPVVTISGRPTFPTTGHLQMTTVGVSDGLHALTALRAWIDPHEELVPRSVIYPSDKTNEQVQKENTAQFDESENNAEIAALTFLKQPVKVVVGPVSPGAPAGSVLKQGDQLLNVKGAEVTSPEQVRQILTTTRPGDDVAIRYQRGTGPAVDGTVKVGSRPDGPQGFLGISPEGRPFDPNQIVISLGDVGGPSAGLLFALAVIDKITPDDLAGGKFIAGTGEIYPTGDVGPIGGIRLKMLGARQDGATDFLVPAANCAEAAANTPAGLHLIKVATLSDAVSALKAIKAGQPVPGC